MRVVLTILRVLGVLLSLVLLAVFIAPITVHILHIGNIAGIVFAVWLFCVSCRPVQQFFSQLMHRTGFTTFLYRAVNVCFVAFAVYGLIVSVAMVIACQTPPAENATAVVLGAHVRPDGSPSQMLYRRIQAAERYLEENPDAKAVLSGGKGDDEVMSEAQCMYNVMTQDGVDPDRLFLEDRSTNTAENFRYSREIMEQNGLTKDITIATDGFHMLRAMLILSQQDFDGRIGAVCADTRLDLLPTYAVREWFALPYQLIKGS